MPELKYGLNLTKKSGLPPLGSRPPPKKTIFDDDDDDDDHSQDEDDHDAQDGPQTISTLGGLETGRSKPGLSKPLVGKGPPKLPSGPPKRKVQAETHYGDLSARHTSLKHAEAAKELDASVYDYDAVYDSIHAKPAKSNDEDKNTGPKYMTALLAAAEVRKRDQLRAKEKALQREREEEGEEYADKEKFVTGAYKAQQEEMRKNEEEEQEREAAETERRRKQGGMTGLYKDLLSREDEKHERAMKAAEDQAKNGPSKPEADGDNEAKDEIILARERGALVNEDGQIVDKRQLLTAGLNVARKSKAQEQRDSQRQQDQRDRVAYRPSASVASGKQAQRERQTQMLERQLEEAAKRAADDEQVEKEALERANKRRTTEKDVMSAKERYLARKAAAAEAAKQGGG